MWKLTFRNLLAERLRLAVSVLGVAAALVLVLLLEGVFAGTSEQIVAYPRRAGADVWVMQPGVSNMHMATSVFPHKHVSDIARVPGVRSATPIMYVNNFVLAGGRDWFSYVVGLQPSATVGGPWSMHSGEARARRGQVVLPVEIARKAGVSLGDTVSVMGRTLVVAGLSRDTYSMANSVTFMHYDELAELMKAKDSASYVLVVADKGVSPTALAAVINQRVAGVYAMPRDAFVESDRALALQMGAEVIRVMTFVGVVVSLLIIGFTIYTASVRRQREHAVAKALGARNLSLFGSTVVQTLCITLLAFVVAIALAYAIRPLIHTLVPEVRVVYPLSSIARLAGLSVFVGALASWLPARRVMRVDPALVFKE